MKYAAHLPERAMFFRLGFSLLLILTCSSASALDLDPDDVRAKSSEKPVSVLQKRYFLKAYRPEIGLLWGSFLNEAYTRTEKRGIRAGLFFSEWVGLELQYIDTSVVSSEDKKALEQLKFPKSKQEPDTQVSPEPEINKIHSVIDANFVFAPFYGKLNLLDMLILYTDLYVAAGGAQVNTDQGKKNAMSFAFGERFYVFKSLSFRVDFRNYSFSELRAGQTTRRNAQSYDFGISWFFL